MNRTIMAVLVAGALLLTAASIGMFADPMDGGSPDHPGVVHEPSGETGPGAGGAAGDASGSGSEGAAIAGKKPGIAAGSGGMGGSRTDAELVQVGDFRGGDILSSDPCPPLDCPPPATMLAGGKGGIGGDFPWRSLPLRVL